MRLGNFRVTENLASGVAGAVWLATGDDGATVILKRSPHSAPTDEFRLLAELDHPAIPRIASCGVEAGRFWVATHRIEGAVLEDGFPEVADEEGFAISALQSILYLDSCGVIHGDIHPGNLLVAGGGSPARLLDFGLASDGEAPPAGRRGFIAPEVRAGGARTTASDLYGLGMSLRERRAARSSGVGRLVEGLVSPDVQVRVGIAGEFAARRPRAACGPRRVCRAGEWGRVAGLLSAGTSAARGVLIVGGAGMGKSELLRRAILEARARGWEVEWDARGSAAELACRWDRGVKPRFVALDDVDRAGGAAEISGALRALRRAGTAGVVLLAAASEPVAGWEGETWTLGRIGEAETGAIFRQVSGVGRLTEAELRRISDVAGGSPGRAVSAARAAAAAGALEFRMGAWELRPQAVLPVPLDAAEAVRPMVEGLDAVAVRALGAVALAAGAISRGALPVAAEAPTEELGRLEAAGLVKPEGAGLVVADAAIANAVVGKLDNASRARIHRRLAALTEEARAPGWVSAWHWVRAGEPEPGIEAALAAAASLSANGDAYGARELLAAARALAVDRPRDGWRLEAALVALDADARAEEATARRAEQIAGRPLDLALKRRMGAIAVSQWYRLRRMDEMESAAGRLAPELGAWILERARFGREFWSRARAGSISAEPLPAVDDCASPAEARFAAWRMAVRGEFGGALRGEMRAMRLAARSGAWREFGAAVDGAVTDLILLGRRDRAERVLGRAHAVALQAGRSGGLSGLASARASVASAAGQVGRGLAALREFDRIAILEGLCAEDRFRCAPLHAQFLRYSGAAEQALGELDARPERLLSATALWDALPRALALLDLGRWEDSASVSAAAASGFGATGDASGRALSDALRVMALRAAESREAWLAAADALPVAVEGDRVAEGYCAWMRLEAALARGDLKRASGLVPEVAALAKRHRLLGCEAAARAAGSFARAGSPAAADALLGTIEPLPDSPMIEVWAAVARARREAHGVAALMRLEGVKELVAVAGCEARRAWLEAAAWAGREAGRLDEAEVWARQAAKEGREEPKSQGGEASVAPKSLASQARYIRDIVREINSERNVARLLEKVLDSAIAISGAERGCLVLVDGDRFEVRAARPVDAGLGAMDAFSRTISDKVILSGEPFQSGNAMEDRRLQGSASIPRLRVHSVVCMPFRLKGEILGSLYLDHRRNADAFDPGAVDALQTLSDLAAVAIENAQLFEAAERQVGALSERAKKLERRLEEVDAQGQGDLEAGLKHRYPAIVGRGPAMVTMLRAMDRATEGRLPVLIQGETGSGKELVARALHANGTFRKGPFVAENCAAISPMLMESELFGHVKGAFSGASGEHEGLFRRADGGVLFLDEIGELELSMQAKLLRVLEDGVVRPVGSDKTQQVKLRIVAATHRNLEELVAAKKFRSDLFYRLTSFRIAVPALRERREDIPDLVHRMFGRTGEFEIDPLAMKLLVASSWPGNVRQLEHVVGVLAAGEVKRISPEAVREVLGQDLVAVDAGEEILSEALERFRASRVQAAIVACDGNLARAAKRLGLTYQGVRKIAAKHKLLALRELCGGVNSGFRKRRRVRRT